MTICNNCGAKNSISNIIVCGIETDYCNECKNPEDFRYIDDYNEQNEMQYIEGDKRNDLKGDED